jgi:hypothetical protein
MPGAHQTDDEIDTNVVGALGVRPLHQEGGRGLGVWVDANPTTRKDTRVKGIPVFVL